MLARTAIGRDLMSPDPSGGCTASGWVGRLRVVAGTVAGAPACALLRGGSGGCGRLRCCGDCRGRLGVPPTVRRIRLGVLSRNDLLMGAVHPIGRHYTRFDRV